MLWSPLLTPFWRASGIGWELSLASGGMLGQSYQKDVQVEGRALGGFRMTPLNLSIHDYLVF